MTYHLYQNTLCKQKYQHHKAKIQIKEISGRYSIEFFRLDTSLPFFSLYYVKELLVLSKLNYEAHISEHPPPPKIVEEKKKIIYKYKHTINWNEQS